MSDGVGAGRNDPCPCGSGLKYKKCCRAKVEAAPPYTSEEREMAREKLAGLSAYVLAREQAAARDDFMEALGEAKEALDEKDAAACETVFDMSFWFDRPLPQGRLVVDLLLSADDFLTDGERRYLQTAREAPLRPREVVEVRPGLSVTLRDLLDGTTVTVRERSASRQLKSSDFLAARILKRGASGEPELECDCLILPALLRGPLVAELAELRASLLQSDRRGGEAAFRREVPEVILDAWVDAIVHPLVPHVTTTDGDDVVLAKVHFTVSDRDRLVQALDGAAALDRDFDRVRWFWEGGNLEGKKVWLGTFSLEGEPLVLETLSVPRAERGRAMVEALAGDAIAHRGTVYEDPTKLVQEQVRAARLGIPVEEPCESLPPDVVEDLTLDHLARYYRAWLDDKIPALKDHTPREAAKDLALRGALEELIFGLEGSYQGALRRNEPAYDPSWMRAELGLAPSTSPAHPPLLAHERWDAAFPDWNVACRAAAVRLRGLPGFDDATSLVVESDLASDLELRRLTKAHRERLQREGLAGSAVAAAVGRVDRQLLATVGFELHRRKTFWVDESLAFLLARTELDVVGEELRVPFPSFALVFSDRHALSLGERLLAADSSCPFAGHILHVATVYVTEERLEAERVLHLGFAFDALGADPPYLVERRIRLVEGARVELVPGEAEPEVLGFDDAPVPRTRPLTGLLHLASTPSSTPRAPGSPPSCGRPRQGVPRQEARAQDRSSAPRRSTSFRGRSRSPAFARSRSWNGFRAAASSSTASWCAGTGDERPSRGRTAGCGGSSPTGKGRTSRRSSRGRTR